ncbi:MAG: hypothetical protein QW279_04785 [Candidatus Jordarchaeaceae archaeon]
MEPFIQVGEVSKIYSIERRVSLKDFNIPVNDLNLYYFYKNVVVKQLNNLRLTATSIKVMLAVLR